MLGYIFDAFKPLDEPNKSTYDKLLDLFLQLLPYTNGDAAEALDWLTQLDRKYQITTSDYGIGDFISDLKKNGFLKENENGSISITPLSEQKIRSNALEEVFGKLKRGNRGNHQTTYTGNNSEITADRRNFSFGDTNEQIDFTESLQNAHRRSGIDSFSLHESDLSVFEREHQTQTSTALLIDISHSMILYGEDRITPAKKVAMALAELITKKYPRDTLDILVFGNDAWPIEIKDLPYLQVGPYHTNTVAGLELGMELLRKRKNLNKQIFMITDGKPTCLKENGEYYMNSFGLDRKIVNKTLDLAAQCRRLHIPITTFMIANDPHLQAFVAEFTEANNGKAFYAGLQGLGDLVFQDYAKNKKRKL